MGGVGQIPLSEIDSYLRLFNIVIPKEEFVLAIKELDHVYLDHVRSIKDERKNKGDDGD